MATMLIKGPDGRVITKPRTQDLKPGWVEVVAEEKSEPAEQPAAEAVAADEPVHAPAELEPLVMPIDEAIRLVDEMESWTDDSAKD